jgi:hypothetical protein
MTSTTDLHRELAKWAVDTRHSVRRRQTEEALPLDEARESVDLRFISLKLLDLLPYHSYVAVRIKVDDPVLLHRHSAVVLGG